MKTDGVEPGGHDSGSQESGGVLTVTRRLRSPVFGLRFHLPVALLGRSAPQTAAGSGTVRPSGARLRRAEAQTGDRSGSAELAAAQVEVGLGMRDGGTEGLRESRATGRPQLFCLDWLMGFDLCEL
jgi:hypothetical protein